MRPTLALRMQQARASPSSRFRSPAPGGVGDGITVRTSFDNALNLPARAKVRLRGTDVGMVTNIVAKDYRAYVTMVVSKNVKLPINTGAELRQAAVGRRLRRLQPPEPDKWSVGGQRQ